MSEGSRTDNTTTVTDKPKETGQTGGGTDAGNRSERPQLTSDKPQDSHQKVSELADGARKPETHLPASKDNPQKVIAENPNMRANWERALEKMYGQGSYEKNIAAYRKEIESLPSGSSRTAGTKQEHAAEKYNELRREFYKQEHEHPSYKYTEAQDRNLGRGNSPDYQPRGKGAGEIEGPQPPNRQIHHIEERSTSPERALDADNAVNVEGFRKGTTHYDAHFSDGAKAGQKWEKDVSEGKRPNAIPPEPKSEVKAPEVKAPEVKAPEVKAPEVKPPEIPGGAAKGVLSEGLGAAGKLLGIAGEILMVRDFARDLEWHDHPDDPKWGKEYHDMFGGTYYRSPAGGWSTRPDDGA